MKARSMLMLLAAFTVGGAVFGFADASGILALFSSSRGSEHDRAWAPITREEYRRRQRSYPLYGGAIGFLVGTVFVIYGAVTKDGRQRDSEAIEHR